MSGRLKCLDCKDRPLRRRSRCAFHLKAKREQINKYYTKNSAKVKTRVARWKANNSDKVYETSKVWRENNVDRVRNHMRTWIVANPEKAAANWANRRARKRGVPGHFTADDYWNLYYMQDGKCGYCKKKRNLTLDHVIPLCHKDSSNWPHNIALACQRCNDSKHDKLLSEWQKRPYYREYCKTEF